jgi:hypothetical protein
MAAHVLSAPSAAHRDLTVLACVLEGVSLDTRSGAVELVVHRRDRRNDPVPSLGHDGAMDTSRLPAPVKATMAGFLTAEMTTISPRGAAHWPVLPSVEWEMGRIVVVTSIGLPQKAHNIRRRPEVCLLFSDQAGSGLADPHSVLVEGSALVTDDRNVRGRATLATGAAGPALRPVAGANDLAVAGSTLAVAGLFSPARRRIQTFVDRRFNRARYDAALTVDAFVARVRDVAELATLRADLMTTVAKTVHPAHVSVWVRDETGGSQALRALGRG